MEKTQVSNDTAWRWFGMALGNVSAAGLVIARCEPDKVRRGGTGLAAATCAHSLARPAGCAPVAHSTQTPHKHARALCVGGPRRS